MQYISANKAGTLILTSLVICLIGSNDPRLLRMVRIQRSLYMEGRNLYRIYGFEPVIARLKL